MWELSGRLAERAKSKNNKKKTMTDSPDYFKVSQRCKQRYGLPRKTNKTSSWVRIFF